MAQNEVNVQVAVRCRPLIWIGEQLEGPAEFIQCLKEQKQVIVNDKMFTFDYVFDSTDGQKTIYDTSVAPIVEKFLQGNNAAVIAYGQTGSGKTFTMGTMEKYNFSKADLEVEEDAQDKGIIPRVLKHIFERVTNWKLSDENKNRPEESSPVIIMSFLEVYNEEVYDILNPSRTKIQIRENAHVVKLLDLKEVGVTSYEEAMKCLSDGAQIRTTEATATNARSSRSHAIIAVQLQRIISGKYVQNRIMLVDLAGSEAVKKTKTEGPRFKEGININRGLLALGNVIRALSKDKGHSYVPYRDSTLSRLLQTCLQGNSNTLIIACINQVENNFLETTSTLQFAVNARAVRIKLLLAGDRDSRTPCRWKGPYNSFVTPTTVNRSRLHRIHIKSATKMPMNSTMLLVNGINDIPNYVKDLSPNIESAPSSAKMELRSSPLPTLDESPIEAVFKKPKTSSQTVQRPTAGFTPYMERICSSFEKCVGKLLANHPLAPPQFDTPTRQTLVDSIAQQTMRALQGCTNVTQRRSEMSTLGTLDDTVIEKCPDVANKKRKRETMPSLLEASAEKNRTSMANISTRRIERRQLLAIENRTLKNESLLQQSVIMSPRRTTERHTTQILNVLNRANVKQLQLLPHIGPKTSLIIYNWRTHNGLFKEMLDLKNIPGLPQTFMKHFVAKNYLMDHIEN